MLKALYSNWRRLRRGRPAPARSDIDPNEIGSVLPHIGLFDVEAAPRRYRVRMMGNQIVNWYGCDLTGRYLDEVDFGIGGTGTFEILDQVVDKIAPAYMSGEYTKHDGRKIRYERLFLPLCDTADNVTALIGAAVRLPAGAPILGDCLDI
ncbi:PAS domain-containing protein [Pelagibius marinus]|uniref:PAS domain-containing protein n=1 Tax=Pelagibius marinus TaxID=2762760 RepID=UPI001872CE5C|nr:PAS domain-containing protein [Pelagibius marinus]